MTTRRRVVELAGKGLGGLTHSGVIGFEEVLPVSGVVLTRATQTAQPTRARKVLALEFLQAGDDAEAAHRNRPALSSTTIFNFVSGLADRASHVAIVLALAGVPPAVGTKSRSTEGESGYGYTNVSTSLRQPAARSGSDARSSMC